VPGWIWPLGGALIGLCLAAVVVIAAFGQIASLSATPATVPPVATSSLDASATPTMLRATATSSPDVVPTPTPTLPTTAAPGDCVLDASYVADVTVPDDTEFAPGEAFVKTWRIRNSSTCDWGSGYKLVFVAGDLIDGEAGAIVPATPVDGTVDVSVNLVAPTVPGTYRGLWKLQSPEGSLFGAYCFVRIKVSE
jgi:hypothetical protein